MASEGFRLEDFLSAVTDALQQGDTDIDQIAKRHRLGREDVGSLVNVIQRLNQHLVMVQPSERFMARLRGDLMNGERGLMQRMRNLPPRVHIAAGAITVAGILYIAQRRFFGVDGALDGDIIVEKPAANN